MDFSEAITAHSQWRIRLQAAISGTSRENLDPKVVGVDDRCVLGQWIHGEAKQFSAVPEYAALVKEHRAFHQCAAQVLTQVATGKLEEAKASVASGEFYQASLRTINAIRHLRAKVSPS